MPKVHLAGKVLPSTISISVNDSPQVKWGLPEAGLESDFTVRIKDSLVDVECNVNRFKSDDLTHLYTRALDFTRAAVDLVSFSCGLGLSVYLDTFINPDGVAASILPQDITLAALCTAFRIDSTHAEDKASFAKVYEIVLAEPALFMALNDLIVAITLPHHSPVNCGRAMDSLRNLIAPLGTPRKDAWGVLRQSLQIQKEYLELITDYSTGPRHGDRTYISGAITTEITRRAWIVMNRFLEFKKRGNKPLPPSEFPLLSS